MDAPALEMYYDLVTSVARLMADIQLKDKYYFGNIDDTDRLIDLKRCPLAGLNNRPHHSVNGTSGALYH
jgi:hypothetical protein